MPIYIYFCKRCGRKIERLRFKREKMGKNPICECGTKMTRTLHPSELRFHGGGWQTPKPKEEK